MVINLTYIFFILIGTYFGILAYRDTRKRQVFPILGIFVLSFVLEIQRLNDASYKLDLNDVMRTLRDIIRTVAMIGFFECMRKHFPYCASCKHIEKKKKIRISSKKMIKKQ